MMTICFLAFVYLESNVFTGRLDGQRLLLFPELEELVVSRNSLAGPIPGEFGSLLKLSTLFLDSNGLSGTVPSELANMAPLGEYRRHPNKRANILWCLTLYLVSFRCSYSPHSGQ